MRISNSFSEGEIQLLDFVIQSLLRGGSPTTAPRHKDFPSLCRKVKAMKAKVAERNAPATTQTGTIAPSADELAKAV
ncbi:MAG: hypothetical protein IPJ88_10270 [Myxococcales bacterium]|nr:MAG: hypothetical protein IPJ88_10270 [Myxococcales bacterium]